MCQIPEHGIHDADVDTDTSTQPCVQALLAATMALMTGHAQACCEDHRNLMAEKVAVNLQELSRHPLITPAFQAVAWSLHLQWAQRMQPEQSRQGRPSVPSIDEASSFDFSRALWHTTPEVIQ